MLDMEPNYVIPRASASDTLPVAPWVLRSWPPVLWQTVQWPKNRFVHLGTRVTFAGDQRVRTAGQTIWGGNMNDGSAGLAWDWVQTSRGIVAMADPLSVVTNLRLIGGEGEVLTSLEASVYLNALVHDLPWQGEVERALRGVLN
jgi:hypothetical protein